MQPERPTRILLMLRSAEVAHEISNQLTGYGFLTTTITHAAELKQNIIQDTTYDMVIVDIDLDTNTKRLIPSHLPTLFYSEKDNLETRLKAVRQGGEIFISPPIDINFLMEKISALMMPLHIQNPYRILIMEDSRTQASFFAKTLNSAGLQTHIETNPMNIYQALTEFSPELILLDLYMPHCSGVELAKVLRQQSSYLDIPIVFLSAENNTAKQLDAMSLGGDDFLTKPIEASHLISSVTSRCMRSRILRAAMVQDSLTGLYNHTKIFGQLAIEISRSQRHNSPLSFAMLDIDHFKIINDNYGHPIGDKIIMLLASLLKQRLRRTDSVGRYGGEEFALIFPDSSVETSHAILSEISSRFTELVKQQNYLTHNHPVTFSVGIAALSETINTPHRLCQAADTAMYLAKKLGRNRITIHNQSNI